jgi:hypothetical protein
MMLERIWRGGIARNWREVNWVGAEEIVNDGAS